MKPYIKFAALGFVSLLLSMNIEAATSTVATPSVQIAGDTVYTLDPMHTYVQWHINHFGFSNPSGKWMVKGNINFNEQHPAASSVTANIDIASIVTGVPELDEHLQGPLFFNVKSFPTAMFVSNKIKITGKKSADIIGTLTLHGVTKPITLHAVLNKIGINPISNQESIGFTAYTKLNRSDFGITTLIPGISDVVTLEVEVEAYKTVAQ